MPKYLFTSDQRISALPERIKWVAEFINSGHNVSDIADKSDNNNAATLKFYYNLHRGTETCEKAVEDPLFAIRNFVLKFQFPNVRTQESLQNTINERLLLAPYRSVVSLLVALAEITNSDTSAMSMSEILYYVFCNPIVYNNPAVHYKEVAAQILDSREQNKEFGDVVGNILKWNQYGRQSRELINVLTFASKCFSFSKGILKYSTANEDYLTDKDYIKELITYNKFWYPTDIQNFNFSTLEYISYMNTVNTPYSVVEFSPNTDEPKKEKDSKPYQQIFYGAPGTGKSHTIDEYTNESNRIRITFHPDYDYATFVGAYKPTVKQVNKYGMWGKVITHDDNTPVQEDVIVYKFIPQAFIKAYVEAWRRYADAECTDKDFYLVIEEINRGNCAQIFGDLFQLLDRTNAGYSSYAVETESDLQDFLAKDEQYKLNITLTDDIKNDKGKVIATAESVMNGKVLVLPPNLHIWATMNTSDQSLFPIDSAFKRRWDWKYVPIKYENNDWKVMLDGKEVCKWTELQQRLNDLIYDATESEDKMLGDWFVKANSENVINEDLLVGKIIFYLWNDVAKVDAGNLFDLEVEKNGRKRKVVFSDFYNTGGNVDSKVVMAWLKNINVLKDTETEEEKQNEPEQ